MCRRCPPRLASLARPFELRPQALVLPAERGDLVPQATQHAVLAVAQSLACLPLLFQRLEPTGLRAQPALRHARPAQHMPRIINNRFHKEGH